MIYFNEAFGALMGYRLRTLLSLAGLVVGVGAVIAIQILGNAMTGATTGIFQGFSNYTFIVYPDFKSGASQKAEMTFPEVAALQSIPNVTLAIPYWSLTQFVRFGHNSAQLAVSGVGSQAQFFSQPLAQGRLITPEEIDDYARVCIISDNAAQNLAPNGDSLLGATIRAGPLECQVVGILEKPPSGAQNFNLGSDIYIPYSTFNRQFLPFRRVYQVLVLVNDVGQISQTEAAVTAKLTELKNGKFKYQTFDNFFIAQLVGKLFGTLTMIVGVIAAISLVVSGIGIMNILLVSITERTREIGIRKAIGAHRAQIMLQFFLEAAILTFTGCGLGTVLGIAIGWWVNSQYIIKISGVIVSVPWLQSVLLATVFAAVVTFAFGTYPAYRAAALNPIEALRYE